MPFLAGLTFLVQLGLAIHCIRSGRAKTWLYPILFLPVVGSLIYVFTQLLPDLRSSPRGRSAANSLAKAADPSRELRRRKELLEISDNVSNRLALADECMQAQLYEEASELYDSCSQLDDDPSIKLKVCQALFARRKFATARESMQTLIELHPQFRSAEGHLLYARILDELDDADAVVEYEALLDSYPGEEARVRYALYLKRHGEHTRAQQLFEESLKRARQAPKFYQEAQRQWLNQAKVELS